MVTFDNKPVYDLESAFPASPVMFPSSPNLFGFFNLNEPMGPEAENCVQHITLVFKMIL